MTVLRYTVPPENEGCKLGLFLRMQGVTAGLIKSVKYDGDGFYAEDVYKRQRKGRRKYKN